MTVATNDPVEVRVRAAVQSGAARWFPDATPAAPLLLAAGATRASRWYRYDVGGRRLFVKAPQRSDRVAGTDRPRLLPLPDFTTKHEVEHRWFLRIAAATSSLPSSPLAPPVRCFGLLAEPPALVLEDLADPTLHARVAATHRRRNQGRATPDHLRAVGRWLAAYHALDDPEGIALGAVLVDAAAVAAAAERFVAALGPRARGLGERVSARAQAVSRATRATVHGDLAPGNVFVSDDGVVRAIDPAPWRAPALLDLAYLATALRTSRAALLVPGGRAVVEPLVQALFEGYGVAHDRQEALEGLLGLTLLDKWAALDARTRAVGVFGGAVERAHRRRVAVISDGTLPR